MVTEAQRQASQKLHSPHPEGHHWVTMMLLTSAWQELRGKGYRVNMGKVPLCCLQVLLAELPLHVGTVGHSSFYVEWISWQQLLESRTDWDWSQKRIHRKGQRWSGWVQLLMLFWARIAQLVGFEKNQCHRLLFHKVGCRSVWNSLLGLIGLGCCGAGWVESPFNLLRS